MSWPGTLWAEERKKARAIRKQDKLKRKLALKKPLRLWWEIFPMKPSEIKHLVWERDDWKCRYCGEDMFNAYAMWRRHVSLGELWGAKVPMTLRPTVDHVIPKSKGGKFTTKNLVTCCTRCNYAKGDSDTFVYESQPVDNIS